MAANVYAECLVRLMQGDINLDDTQELKVSIQGASYTGVFDVDHTDWNTQIKSHQINVGGYDFDGGGKVIVDDGARLIEDDAANNRVEWHAGHITWATLTSATIRSFVTYVSSATAWATGATAAQYVPITYHTTTTDSNGGDYTLQWDGQGIMQITY